MGQQQYAPQQSQPTTSPYVDVFDNAEEITVVADLPGCDPESIELEGSDSSLRIRGERPEEPEAQADEERAVQRERLQQAERVVNLPAEVEVEDAEATCENGVCRVTLPKREQERQRQIAFQ